MALAKARPQKKQRNLSAVKFVIFGQMNNSGPGHTCNWACGEVQGSVHSRRERSANGRTCPSTVLEVTPGIVPQQLRSRTLSSTRPALGWAQTILRNKESGPPATVADNTMLSLGKRSVSPPRPPYHNRRLGQSYWVLFGISYFCLETPSYEQMLPFTSFSVPDRCASVSFPHPCTFCSTARSFRDSAYSNKTSLALHLKL